MQRLFLFLYQYRALFTFLILEVLCAWLIIENNTYQSAKYFNSSNRIAANMLQTSSGIRDYFGLKEVNEILANENALLKKQLEEYNQSLHYFDVTQNCDNDILNKYQFISAKVINNSTRRFDNYITVDKGKKHGIEEGMAVIDGFGVVGKVKNVSSNFSVITSVLHGNALISSKIKRTGDLCTAAWDGIDSRFAELLYVPRHVKLQKGDTIVTSGYNAVFPEDIPVGIVASFDISEDAQFFNVKIKLSSDLNSLSFVYLIRNNLKIEQDSIQNITIN
jgi:rod shape-determining protein MreC